MQHYGATTLLVTQKDAVKMRDFTLPLSLMKLQINIADSVFTKINHYVDNH